MKFSESLGRQVVSTSTATTIGTVKSFVVDPQARRVVAVQIKGSGRNRDVLPWSALTAFGQDAVTVADETALQDHEALAELLGKDHQVTEKRVLTEQGVVVGTVVDVEFDEQTGDVTSLLTDAEPIAGQRLIGVGGYAVVVRRES